MDRVCSCLSVPLWEQQRAQYRLSAVAIAWNLFKPSSFALLVAESSHIELPPLWHLRQLCRPANRRSPQAQRFGFWILPRRSER
jgi:hypothetical protein